jgi:hypothetical protein
MFRWRMMMKRDFPSAELCGLGGPRSYLPDALAFGLLLHEQRLQRVANPGEGGFEAFALVNDADLRLDGGGIAVAGEELVAGEAGLHLRIDFALLA